MVRKARKAYACLGGKYPHSESIVPGGVSVTPDIQHFENYKSTLKVFADYSEQTAAVWDDIFDFMLEADFRYADVGRSDASMVDFGQWDHEEIYDGSYQNCDVWGEKRWSTPRRCDKRPAGQYKTFRNQRRAGRIHRSFL